jgi:hypothetical protein
MGIYAFFKFPISPWDLLSRHENTANRFWVTSNS